MRTRGLGLRWDLAEMGPVEHGSREGPAVLAPVCCSHNPRGPSEVASFLQMHSVDFRSHWLPSSGTRAPGGYMLGHSGVCRKESVMARKTSQVKKCKPLVTE